MRVTIWVTQPSYRGARVNSMAQGITAQQPPLTKCVRNGVFGMDGSGAKRGTVSATQ